MIGNFWEYFPNVPEGNSDWDHHKWIRSIVVACFLLIIAVDCFSEFSRDFDYREDCFRLSVLDLYVRGACIVECGEQAFPASESVGGWRPSVLN